LDCVFYVDETQRCLVGLECPCEFYAESIVPYHNQKSCSKFLEDHQAEFKLFLHNPDDIFRGVMLVPLTDGIAVVPFEIDDSRVVHEGTPHKLINRKEVVDYIKQCRLFRSQLDSIEHLLLGVFKDLDDAPEHFYVRVEKSKRGNVPR